MITIFQGRESTSKQILGSKDTNKLKQRCENHSKQSKRENESEENQINEKRFTEIRKFKGCVLSDLARLLSIL